MREGAESYGDILTHTIDACKWATGRLFYPFVSDLGKVLPPPEG